MSSADIDKFTEGDDFLEKFYNTIMIDPSSGPPEYTETKDHLFIPTAIVKAGVFTGTDGIPTKKTWDAIKSYSDAFLGRPITNGHIEGWPGIDTPTLGRIISVQPDDEKKTLYGISKVDKHKVTPEQIDLLKKGVVGGSPGYFAHTTNENGNFGGKDYTRVENDYEVAEYAFLFDTPAACETCGPFHNSQIVNLAKGDKNMVEETKPAGITGDEFKKILNEAMKPVLDRVEALETSTKQLNAAGSEEMDKRVKALEDAEKVKAEAAEAAKIKVDEEAEKVPVVPKPVMDKLDEIDKAVKASNASGEQLAARIKALETQEESRIAGVQKEKFAKTLNAGGQAELDKNYSEYLKDPAAWVIANPTKLLNSKPDEKELKGKVLNTGDVQASIEASRTAALKAYHEVGTKVSPGA